MNKIWWLIIFGGTLLILMKPMTILIAICVGAIVVLIVGGINGFNAGPRQESVSINQTPLNPSIYHLVNPRTGISEIMKREILARQRGLCGHPGCGHRYNLELHHIIPKQFGGKDEVRNLIYLCPNHHRFAHETIRRRQRR